MFLEVLAFNDEILLISDSFVTLQYESNTDFTIAKYTPYIKPRYVTREGTTVLYVDITTIELSVRSSLPDTVLNRNTGILKRDGLSALVQTMMRLMPA
ncbi:integrase [Bacteroides ovatus]|nr:integrase [Bacteroides ovatus]